MDTQETSIYTAVLIVALFLSAIVVFFLATIIYQQRKYQRMYQERIGSEIVMLEKERIRIADHLHDEFGPMLFAARMKFISIDPPDNKSLLAQNKGLEHLDKVIKNLRSITEQIMPGSLFDKDLVTALQVFFSDIQANYPLELSFNVSGLPGFSETSGIYIYRILQEIIFNTIKHSGAKSLTIESYTSGNQFIICTADDGTGFNYKEAIRSNKGQGLKNIMNRVQLLHGQAHVRSDKNKGACFYISIPLKSLHENNSHTVVAGR
jgi:signal transduction histidine kinase